MYLSLGRGKEDGLGEQQLKPLEVLVEGEIDSKQFLNKDVSLFIYFLTTDGKIIGGHSFDIENVQNEKITIKEKLDEQQIESVPSVDKVFVDIKEK